MELHTSEIWLDIKPPERRHRNGIISELKVDLVQVDDSSVQQSHVFVVTDPEVVEHHKFLDLIPFTYYTITVTAKNGAGYGAPFVTTNRTIENGTLLEFL